jgi:hypothetical protein
VVFLREFLLARQVLDFLWLNVSQGRSSCSNLLVQADQFSLDGMNLSMRSIRGLGFFEFLQELCTLLLSSNCFMNGMLLLLQVTSAFEVSIGLGMFDGLCNLVKLLVQQSLTNLRRSQRADLGCHLVQFLRQGSNSGLITIFLRCCDLRFQLSSLFSQNITDRFAMTTMNLACNDL